MHRNLAKQKSAYVKLPLDLLNVHTGLGVGNISYLLDVFGTACNSLRGVFFFFFFKSHMLRRHHYLPPPNRKMFCLPHVFTR